MSQSTSLPLRLLYTINSSPQYILARSLAPVPVYLVPNGSLESSSRSLYASVSLKRCLDTICRSSPELVQDNSRDFSVYVLDPLESHSAPAPVNISNASAASSFQEPSYRPHGVAVGLGFMSWALQGGESDNINVVGTMIRQASGTEALEVIFALRETASMQKTSLPAAVQSWGLPPPNSKIKQHPQSSSNQSGDMSSHAASSTSGPQSRSTTPLDSSTATTIASILTRSKPKAKPIKAPRVTNIPITQSDRFLAVPDIYIGPVKKKGRPKASSSGADHPVASSSGTKHDEDSIAVDDASGGTTATHRLQKTLQQSTTEVADKAADDSRVDLSAEFGATTILDLLAALSATSDSKSVQNSVVLSALNAIDSGSRQSTTDSLSATGNQELFSAIKQLLSVCSAQPPPPSTPRSASLGSNHTSASRSQEDEIVVLDKENVNPTAFRRRKEKEYLDGKLAGPPSLTHSDAAYAESHSTSQRRGLAGRSGEKLSPKHKSPSDTTSTALDEPRRKRRLSDFMDERESTRTKAKAKERERAERRDTHRHRQNSSSENSMRHYPRLLSFDQARPLQPSSSTKSYYPQPQEPWTSPPKPSNSNSNALVNKNGEALELNANSEGSSGKHISASSPANSSRVQNPRKQYVVPEWARTSTATQPRLSEEAQRALEDAEEKKKKERMAGRRKVAASVQEKVNHRERRSTLKAATLNTNNIPDASKAVAEQTIELRGPIAASSDCPLFGTDDRLASSSPSKSSSRPSSPVPNSFAFPTTPVRDRRSVSATSRSACGAESDSLFTPGPRSTGYSPLFTPHCGTITSPLANRKKLKLSPSRSTFLNGAGMQMFPKQFVESDSSIVDGDGEDIDSALDQALSEAFDYECPPSSLPIASSDIDTDHSVAKLNHDSVVPQYGDDDHSPKQHWIGLPPSSPPRATSPALSPDDDMDDQMDDLELPVAASDSEVDDYLNELQTCTPNDISNSPATSTNVLALDNSGVEVVSDNANLDMDIFDQFTNLNAQSSDAPQEMDDTTMSLEGTCFENIDLSEFWATFKPLIQDNSNVNDGSCMGGADLGFPFGNGGFGLDLEGDGMLDHAKLTEEVHALFSGCLL